MYKILSIAISLGTFAACAPVVPAELADARRAYSQAVQGPASEVAPAELHKARETLDVAERSFADEPKSQRTRDLSYVAERRAEQADAIGHTELARQARLSAERDYTAAQSMLLGQARTNLSASERALADAEAQRGVDRQKIADANRRAADSESRLKDAQDALTRIAEVKQEDRGLVITLSGSVLFPSNQATLLPEARSRLDQVAQALLGTKERKIIVEGFTDSRGTDMYNMDLSRRRAEAVRAYIVSRGYDPDLISSEGMGKAQPVADNASAEGRANNRRVEIVVKNKGD